MPTSRMKSRIALLCAALAAVALTACNTVQGIGKDITYIGEKGEEAISE
ncbi:MAG TPA: entericidin A [Phycisphaerales bacterium]|nr:entericidin A [Phycisphaerales bacterium]